MGLKINRQASNTGTITTHKATYRWEYNPVKQTTSLYSQTDKLVCEVPVEKGNYVTVEYRNRLAMYISKVEQTRLYLTQMKQLNVKINLAQFPELKAIAITATSDKKKTDNCKLEIFDISKFTTTI